MLINRGRDPSLSAAECVPRDDRSPIFVLRREAKLSARIYSFRLLPPLRPIICCAIACEGSEAGQTSAQSDDSRRTFFRLSNRNQFSFYFALASDHVRPSINKRFNCKKSEGKSCARDSGEVKLRLR